MQVTRKGKRLHPQSTNKRFLLLAFLNRLASFKIFYRDNAWYSVRNSGFNAHYIGIDDVQ
jgi:hypothetical protein